MDILDLIKALLVCDALTARQWLADAQRAGFIGRGTAAIRPRSHRARSCCWCDRTVGVPGGTSTTFVDGCGSSLAGAGLPCCAAETLPRLRALCEREGPEPLRHRVSSRSSCFRLNSDSLGQMNGQIHHEVSDLVRDGIGPFGETPAVAAALGELKRTDPIRYSTAIVRRLPTCSFRANGSLSSK